MKNKDSFILYADQKEVINELSDEQAGKLFKAIYDYAGGNKPQLEGLAKIAFIPIRQQIDRNNEKYEATKEKRRIAGSKGGKQKVANLANATFAKNFLANQADNVNDNVNENVNDKKEKEIKKEKEKEILKNFNEFYLMYPLKKSKDRALQAYKKAILAAEQSAIMDGLKRYIDDIRIKRTEPQFIKHPSTWLNQKCWEDEYDSYIDYSDPRYHNSRL